MQTINVESKVPISLDRIIDYILDNLEENTPAFVRECDQKVSQELHAYTKDIMAQDNINVPDIVISEKAAEIAETKSSELLNRAVQGKQCLFRDGCTYWRKLIMATAGFIRTIKYYYIMITIGTFSYAYENQGQQSRSSSTTLRFSIKKIVKFFFISFLRKHNW